MENSIKIKDVSHHSRLLDKDTLRVWLYPSGDRVYLEVKRGPDVSGIQQSVAGKLTKAQWNQLRQGLEARFETLLPSYSACEACGQELPNA